MSSPTLVRVSLEDRSYAIVIGSGLIDNAAEHLSDVLPGKRVIIVSDEAVAPIYAARLQAALDKGGIRSDLLVVETGEGAKSFASLESLMNRLLALSPDRKTTLVALGGGVVGDLTGFAASILLRGVPFVQVPTTLLAQVDSSVGGKTAINAPAGKNLIGSFYQPQRVLIDLDTLKTLPPREMRAGYAEIIKYGLIMNAEFYRWCLEHGAALMAGDATALHHAVRECCRMKAEIVAGDEREAGKRALLNFGHTFGHALEAELQYDSRMLHGEAVAIGMGMACRLSAKLGMLAPEVETQLMAHLHALGLPTTPKAVTHAWDARTIAAHFASDKKTENGALTFVLLASVGDAQAIKNIDRDLAESVVASYLN